MWNRTKPFSKFYFYLVLPTMPDRCDQTNVIYQADVHAENKIMSYYGSTENEFKKRYSTHKSSFKKKTQMPHYAILTHSEIKGQTNTLWDKVVNQSKGACILKWRSCMPLVPYWKTCNFNGRPKFNVEQKRWTAGNSISVRLIMYQLQFSKMEPLYLTQFGIECRKVTQVQRFKSNFLFLNNSREGRKETVVFKVHIFWEGHKILRNLPLTIDYSTYSQK